MTKIAVFSAGSWGTAFSVVLGDAGHDVTLIARPAHVAAITQAGGLWLHTDAGQECIALHASTEASALRGAQWVLFCVKSTDTDSAGHAMAAHLDAGAVVLRYRRLVSMFAPTPHDVWQLYLQVYGLDAVFPVADTVLGRLACIASEEILYPEIARVLALKGAEVFLHSTSEVGSTRLTPKDVAKRARAYENMAWVVSANSAGILGSDFPTQSTDGMSKIVDYKGEVRIEAGFGESMVAHGEIDVMAVRRARAKPGIVYPANTMLAADGSVAVPGRPHFMAMQQRAIEALRGRGVLGATDEP